MSLQISGMRDMPVAETYFLASKARAKLSKEARRHDHNLRVLVSHANLLDNLMDSLAEKRSAGIPTKATSPAPVAEKKTTFAPLPVPDRTPASVVYEQEDDDEPEFEYSDSSDDDYYDEEDDEDDEFEDAAFEQVHVPVATKKEFRSLPTVDEDPVEEAELELEGSAPLTRSTSDSSSSVPSLSYSSGEEDDEDEEEEDEDESEEYIVKETKSTAPKKASTHQPTPSPTALHLEQAAEIVVV